ncbi:MAG: PEGA domain-containing protein [Porticoccaceae bacterium]|jgi:formylglycine-generating enzyme required for sulfatase activity|nr:PEGA domain-containing protein [Porticoccaceae bacterium]MEA3300513.1 PEGA domain-containing protein [Pseudomonadota bacterium]
MSDRRSPSPSTPADGAITPIAFKPVGESRRHPRRALPVAAIAIGAVLILCLAGLWFVLGARSLAVNVTPAEARVELEGGLAIALADHYLLRPGQYRLRVSAPGHVDHQQTIDIADDLRLDIALDRQPGQLAITTDPPGARVVLANQDRGTTPLTLAELPAGRYPLRLTHPRAKPWQGEVEIQGMAITDQLAIALQPAWGLVALTSVPAGAEVSVGGNPVGTTPVTVQVLESGEPVAVKLAGHKRWERVLRGKVGETLTHEPIVLAPADGLATVTSTPAGATVTVNGDYRGRTPLELELPPGKAQRIALFLDGYHTEERSLTLASGEEQQLAVAMRANSGVITLSASPAGARIFVDGQPREAGPLTLPARPHRIEARLAGHVSESRTLTPKPGAEQKVHFDLRPEAAREPPGPAAQITSGAGQRLRLFRPEATFTLGSSRREQGRRANEVQRLVSLTKPFYLAETPVTNAEYKKFQVTHSSSHFNRNTLDLPDQPVVRVSWQDAARYCNWLSERDGLAPFYSDKGGRIVGVNADASGYRLPTEAEWEWAARHDGGTMKRFPWGDAFPPPANAGNYADQSAANVLGRVLAGYRDGQVVSAPVRQFPPNPRGLYGLGHNVAEWVHDYYGIEPTLGTQPLVDPQGPAKGEFRVIRGASWRHGSITELRLSFRDYGSDGRDDLGFRIARYAQ